jgi:hypothetical protein
MSRRKSYPYTIALMRFKTIPTADQLELVSIYGGEPLCQIVNTDFAYTLFWFDSFYVELLQDTNDWDVVEVRAYKSADNLDKFLDEVNIYELY